MIHAPAPSGGAQSSRQHQARTSLGDHVKRSLVATLAFCLALAVAPTALAADPAATDPGATASAAPADPSASPSAAPTDDGTPPGGDVSIDPPFVTPTPAANPSGAVLAATGRPVATLPPTDSIAPATAPGSATLQALLIALGALSALVLLAGGLPGVRRR